MASVRELERACEESQGLMGKADGVYVDTCTRKTESDTANVETKEVRSDGKDGR